jgi:hypothetical protein
MTRVAEAQMYVVSAFPAGNEGNSNSGRQLAFFPGGWGSAMLGGLIGNSNAISKLAARQSKLFADGIWSAKDQNKYDKDLAKAFRDRDVAPALFIQRPILFASNIWRGKPG